VNNKTFFFKNILLLALGLVTVAAVVFWFAKSPGTSGKEYAVELKEDGFTPSDITIHKGDAIIFTTTAGKPFWPASDPHPTHGIYSGFDPRQPIDPDKSWSFKFDKAGTWKYHDHLWPAHRGTVVVEEGWSRSDAAQTDTSWQSLIDSALETKGLDAAFEVLAGLYADEPGFASDCHGYTHELGEAAYKKFAKHESLTLSAKAYYCGYGFYHGFMESLLRAGGQVEDARDFCAYAGKTLASQTSDAEGACYHGIGHGSVDGGDPRSWGDPQAMLAPGLKLCEFVAKEKDQLYRCVTGAYNALEILSMNPKYKLSAIVNDPFGLCPSQPEAYREPCYTNMLPALLRFTKNDFALAAKKISQIPVDINHPSLRLLGYPTRKMVTQSLFHEYIRAHLGGQNYDIAEGVTICRSLMEDMRIPCVEGLSGGHMKYGEPGSEYIKGLAFCRSNLLHEDERGACFEYILVRLKIWYSLDKVRQICSALEENYKKFCGI